MNKQRRSFLKSLPVSTGLLAAGRRTFAASLGAMPITGSASSDAAEQKNSSIETSGPIPEITKVERGFLLKARKYSVRYVQAEIPSFEVIQEGATVFHLPAVSGLWTRDGKERLTGLAAGAMAKVDDHCEVTVAATSSLWKGRMFRWSFFPDHIEFQQHAEGPAALGRCFFFSNGISGNWDNGSSPGVRANATIFADGYFTPAVNLADVAQFTIAMPQSVGILPATASGPGYHPLEWNGDFAPPPLGLVFRKRNVWTSVGIGTRPGSYLFNALEYTGSRYAGASFYVDYLGYRTAREGFDSPTVALHFGYDEFATLEQYIAWIDAKGFSTAHRYPNARWHHLPIFCGWGEQENQTRLHRGVPHDFCTQANYEKWIADLEAKNLPVGNIIIDDKWQKHYGTFEIDEEKWPDLHAFTAHQHARGRHVLLWVPAYNPEGLEKSLCVLDQGRPIAADVTNPHYETFLRGRIRRLVQKVGIDGFKEDWIGGVTRKPDVEMHKPMIGIEFERRFQFILHDEAHRWKPEALVETQTPNPLFRESSDVLRLNDIWYGSRDVTAVMRRRARIALLAGWPLVDCDDASSTDLEEWWKYMQSQPAIGIPSLYIVSRMKSTLEDVPGRYWTFLASIWKHYVQDV